jgi:hypothetical protein
VGGGLHLVVPEPEIAAGDLLALTTRWLLLSTLVSYTHTAAAASASDAAVASVGWKTTGQRWSAKKA